MCIFEINFLVFVQATKGNIKLQVSQNFIYFCMQSCISLTTSHIFFINQKINNKPLVSKNIKPSFKPKAQKNDLFSDNNQNAFDDLLNTSNTSKEKKTNNNPKAIKPVMNAKIPKKQEISISSTSKDKTADNFFDDLNQSSSNHQTKDNKLSSLKTNKEDKIPSNQNLNQSKNANTLKNKETLRVACQVL